MFNFQAVERRHDLDHLDVIPLHPKRHGHENDFRDDCEKGDCDPPVARKFITRLNDELQNARDCCKHIVLSIEL